MKPSSRPPAIALPTRCRCLATRCLAACCLIAGNPGWTAERLELEVTTATGHSYQAEQSLGDSFSEFSSDVIPGGEPPREYLAMRCGGPWGAQKFRLPLASGPGYQLRALDGKLLLRIVEHSVISADASIAAMTMHCVDMEPTQVVKAIAEIELDRGSSVTEELQLDNGYLLSYRYTP